MLNPKKHKETLNPKSLTYKTLEYLKLKNPKP